MNHGYKVYGFVVLTLLLANLVAAQTLYVDEQFGFTLTAGVVYASKPAGSPVVNLDLALELYQPSGAGVPDNRPAIILIHGGGFVSGNRFNARLIEMCKRMARRGYACVSIDYRLQGDNPVVGTPFVPIENLFNLSGDPRGAAAAASTEDAWAAYQWIVNNASGLNIDINRVGVGGSSAGAVTALYMGYALDKTGVAAPNTFAAVFDMWGALLGPSSLIQAGDAPLLITHGDSDLTVSVDAAYTLETQSIAVGLTHEIYILPGAGHGYDIFNELVTPSETMFDRTVAFFYQHVALDESSDYKVPMTTTGTRILLLVLLLISASYAYSRLTLRRAK